MEYADVCHTTPLPPHSASSSLAEIELTSAAAAAAPCQLPGPMHRPNRKYMRVYLQPHTSTPSFPPFPLSRLHWLRFQNCKLDLLNFSKLQQQEANRQRLAKVLPKSLQPIIT